MKKTYLITVLVLLILVGGIGIASAETLTGSLGSEAWNTTNYCNSDSSGGVHSPITHIMFNDIEYSSGFKSLIHWQNQTVFEFWLENKGGSTHDPAALTGTSTPVIFRLGNATFYGSGNWTPKYTDGPILGTGTIGYQRVFNTASPPVEQPNGYVWVIVNDDWNITGLSGDTFVFLDYDRSNLFNISASKFRGTSTLQPGYGEFSGIAAMWGPYTMNRLSEAYSEYSVTKPAGLGISGNVSKNGYSSQIVIADSAHATIASELLLSNSDFSFTVYSDQIYVCMKSSLGTWYNSTLLFSPGSPTPTPTPTQPIGPDNPIPAGYIRTMAQCVDGQTSGSIHDCHLDLYDVENTSWSNGSYLDMGSYYGTWWIDTLPGHTINAYASSTGYTPVSRLNLPASSTYMYELILWPTSIPAAGSGFVNLYVLVHDADSGNAITGAAVQVRILDGTTYAQTTGTSGSRMFKVPNSSYTSVTVTKYGYISATRGITTSASGDDTLRIELQRKVITTVPTQTIPPGGVTTAVTMDPRTASEKDRDMMDQIRNAGPTLIELAIAATTLGLLGLMMKVIK